MTGPRPAGLIDRNAWIAMSNTYITRLMERGFNYADAYEWRFLPLSGGICYELILDVPCTYRDAGFTAREGRDWFTIYMDADDSAAYANHGWTPIAVRRLRKVIHVADDTTDIDWGGGPGDRRPMENVWIRTGISPHYTCLYILSGHTPATAVQLDERRRAGDHHIDAALSALAALRSPTP